MVVDILFECHVTAWHLLPSRTQPCATTAGTPGTCGTSRSSNTPGGARVEAERQPTLSSADNLPRPVPSTNGYEQAVRRFSNRHCVISTRRCGTSTAAPTVARRGVRRDVMRGSGSSPSSPSTYAGLAGEAAGVDPEGGVDAFPLVAEGTRWREVLPGHPGPRGAVAHRLRRRPCTYPCAGHRRNRRH